MVNFKRYPEASGEKAEKLCRICQQVSQETGVKIYPCPQVVDLPQCTQLGIECWTQRFEPAHLAQKGTLLNHSDYRLERSILEEEVYLSVSRGDKVCICTANPEETEDLLKLKPTYFGYEPPELIGSVTTSVAQSKPEDSGGR